jgi:hypothetical protein
MEQAMRERARHLRIASIVNNERLTEIPRAELDLKALGGRMTNTSRAPMGTTSSPISGTLGSSVTMWSRTSSARTRRRSCSSVAIGPRAVPSSSRYAPREERKAAQQAAAKARLTERLKALR